MKKPITDEMFQNKLISIVGRMTSCDLLTIPGIYEILSEELNNQIIEEIEDEQQEDEEEIEK